MRMNGVVNLKAESPAQLPAAKEPELHVNLPNITLLPHLRVPAILLALPSLDFSLYRHATIPGFLLTTV